MATKNNPGEFDCYSRAEPDEPLVTFLARDRHFALVAEFWCVLRAAEGEAPAVLAEMRKVIADARAWRAAHRPATGEPREMGRPVLTFLLDELREMGQQRDYLAARQAEPLAANRMLVEEKRRAATPPQLLGPELAGIASDVLLALASLAHGGDRHRYDAVEHLKAAAAALVRLHPRPAEGSKETRG